MVATNHPQTRRLELILRQIDTLPTLPAVATRLLSLTADDDASAKQVTELIETDPSLTAKVLSLCRTADKGVRADLLSVDRAVVLLGFTAIRNTVLSLKVIEVFDADGAEPGQGQKPSLERRAFWSHSLAVAIAAESIAKAHRDPDLPADEAFVCGLLHDIGKLTLDHVLPQAYRRVIELAEAHRRNIAEFERSVLGLDHHTAGKRLAEQWGLPLRLQDCIWLHGSTPDTMPRVPHSRLVGLIRLADVIVRQCHIGYSGNYLLSGDASAMAQRLGLDPVKVRQATSNLFETLEERGRLLGIYDEPTQELFLESIQRANAALGRVNAAMEKRSRAASSQSAILKAVTQFHADARPGRSVQDALDAVAASAHGLLGEGHFTLVYPQPIANSGPQFDAAGNYVEQGGWLVSQYSRLAEPTLAGYVFPEADAPDLTRGDADQPSGIDTRGLVQCLERAEHPMPDPGLMHALPLPSGWGIVAILLHDRGQAPAWELLRPLAAVWGAAIAAAAQHDGARRMGEQLAEANAALAEAQDRLLETESLARVGEMAAGAAHEMNNPLSVISGRSQLLCMTLPENSKQLKTAQAIFRESHRLSDLISCLRMFADPPNAKRKPTDLAALLKEVTGRIRSAAQKRQDRFDIQLEMAGEGATSVYLDPEQVDRAVTELLFNAVQANPRSRVNVSADLIDAERQLLIRVTDDGEGMNPHTLQHAMDPFFSAKPAGRQVGMGLPRVQQLMRAHNGLIRLASREGEGTTATLLIPLDCEPVLPDESVAAPSLDPQGVTP